MSNPQPGISPELQAFSNSLVANVRAVSEQETKKLIDAQNARLAQLESNLRAEFKERIEAAEDSLRSEIKDSISRVERALEKQDDILDQHTIDIAKIQARLDEGDRRFEKVEGQTKETGDDAVDNKVSLAKLATQVGAIAGAGGAVGAAISTVMQHHP